MEIDYARARTTVEIDYARARTHTQLPSLWDIVGMTIPLKPKKFIIRRMFV